MFLRGEVTFADGFEGSVCMRLVFKGCLKAVSGAPCRNCHNPELWDFTDGSDPAERLGVFEMQLADWAKTGVRFDAVTVIGGEPLDQNEGECVAVIDLVKKYYPDIPFFVYTGMDEEKFFRNSRYRDHVLAGAARYMKFGPYVEELATPEDFPGRPFLGSMNQNIYIIERKSGTEKFTRISL